ASRPALNPGWTPTGTFRCEIRRQTRPTRAQSTATIRAMSPNPSDPSDEVAFSVDMRRKRQPRRAGGAALVAERARRQHGLVSRRQLERLGFEESAINRRLRLGRLHRIHAGVFAVGHPLISRRGRWMAAVLALGDGAVLSHRSAAALWGLRGQSGG